MIELRFHVLRLSPWHKMIALFSVDLISCQTCFKFAFCDSEFFENEIWFSQPIRIALKWCFVYTSIINWEKAELMQRIHRLILRVMHWTFSLSLSLALLRWFWFINYTRRFYIGTRWERQIQFQSNKKKTI